MKPLSLQLDDMRELLDILDTMETGSEGDAGIEDAGFRRLLEFSARAEERCEQLRAAEEFAARMQAHSFG